MGRKTSGPSRTGETRPAGVGPRSASLRPAAVLRKTSRKRAPLMPNSVNLRQFAADACRRFRRHRSVQSIKRALPEGVVVKPIYERTDLVEKAVGTAEKALIEGSILVAIVLFLFLGEIRSALVVITALPLAMLIAFIMMNQIGLSANLMSLAGLAIGIGMMVDGAVVMVENSFRIIAERKSEHDGRVAFANDGAGVNAGKQTTDLLAGQGALWLVVFSSAKLVP